MSVNTINVDPNNINIIAVVIMAFFTGLIWHLNHRQQKQYKNPIPEIYFSEPQIMAVSKKDRKILITFLVHFLNTGLSPIVGTGLEHRVENLQTREKYNFGKTRFGSSMDSSFGAILPEIHLALVRFPSLEKLYGYEEKFPHLLFKNKRQLKEEVKVFSLYPYQKPEELWFPEKFYLSDIYIKDYPWVIAPHKFKIIRWYVKVPYKNKKYYSFKIKLILHYYCGGKSNETLKSKEFKINPKLVGDTLCFYETIHKGRFLQKIKDFFKRIKT